MTPFFFIDVHPEVASDYTQAYDWYEAQQKGLGERFLQEVRKQLRQISTNPEIHGTKNKKGFREAIVRHFPFLIVYKIYPKTGRVFIASVHHTSQNPRKKYRK